ncbi:hypothetical protein CSE16_08425 [Solibacillus sp. R5-41]|nr:hypothetical protein CSE16_08425 [Solibacillus sp. R5-41]
MHTDRTPDMVFYGEIQITLLSSQVIARNSFFNKVKKIEQAKIKFITFKLQTFPNKSLNTNQKAANIVK